MRLQLQFSIEKPQLDIDMRRYFVSWIKKSLTIAKEGKFYNKFYNGTMEKDFSFSITLPQPKFYKTLVTFEPGMPIMVNFSISNVNNLGLILSNCFLTMKNKQFKLNDGNAMTLVNVKQLNEKLIDNNRAIFSTIGGSSIIVKDHNRESNLDRYYSFGNEGFIEKFTEKLKNQCERAGFTKVDVDSIRINDINGKKVVVKNYGIYIDGFAGIMDISAAPIVLQHLYTVGLLSKRSMGFGFVDVISQLDN